MAATHRLLVPSSLRELSRQAGLAVAAGALVGLAGWISDPSGLLLGHVLVASYVGLTIYLAALLLGLLVGARLGRVSGRSRGLALAVTFFAAGVLGWLLAILTLPWVSLGRVEIDATDFGAAPLFIGALGLAIGLAIYAYESLRRKLEESVARVKEQEFAAREFATARDIQRRLLPPGEYEGEGFVVAARVEPAGFVAGDFYDYFRRSDRRLVVVVADVAGKGMGASLLMASTKAMLPFVAGQGDAAQILTALNQKLQATLGSRQFVALALLLFAPDTGTFELANGGLPDPYRLADGSAQPLEVPGPRLPLGVRAPVAYQQLRGRLEPGERLLFVSDGLPEAPQADGEALGYDGFGSLLTGISGHPSRTVEQLFEAVGSHADESRVDDWTALVLERSRS